MTNLTGAAIVGQSGGPTAVINATLAGVIAGSLESDARQYITRLYGMRNGIEGFLDGRMTDLTAMFSDAAGEPDEEKLELLIQTPGAALGSCRRKLPDPEQEEFYNALLEKFREHDIRYFFYIGGNDSMDTVRKLSAYVEKHSYEMCVIGLPKTVDNDLPGTDHAPGYGSAAKMIACEVQEIVRDCAVYTVPAVTIVEIMGRDAGWLTAASALPRAVGGYAPDLVYLPEVPFSMEAFLADLRALFRVKPNIVVAVSEGLRNSDGKYVGDSDQNGAIDVFGHRYLAGTARTLEHAVKKEFGCKVRSVELNLPQRCAAHIISLTDRNEATEAGKAGIRTALENKSGCMISIVREPGEEYAVKYENHPVDEIANRERKVPETFITPEKNNVTDECLRYILPLIQGNADIRMNAGIPVHFVIE